MTIQRQYFPNDEDQTGAAKALLRLQDTYNLDTDTISRGNLPGKILVIFVSIWGKTFQKMNLQKPIEGVGD